METPRKVPSRIPDGYRIGPAAGNQEEFQDPSCSSTGNVGEQNSGEKIVLDTPSACDANTLARLFGEIYKSVSSMTEGQQKDEALQAAARLEIEARKGPEAGEMDVESQFTRLKKACPDAWKKAVETFIVPRPGVDPIFQVVAGRMKTAG